MTNAFYAHSVAVNPSKARETHMVCLSYTGHNLKLIGLTLIVGMRSLKDTK